jgi:hypothetical protein
MIIKSGQDPTEREPDAPDNLTERELKSPMIASPAADNLKPLHVEVAGKPEMVENLAQHGSAVLDGGLRNSTVAHPPGDHPPPTLIFHHVRGRYRIEAGGLTPSGRRT